MIQTLITIFTFMAVAAVILHVRYVYEVYQDLRCLNTPEGYKIALGAATRAGTSVQALRAIATRTFNVELSRAGINTIIALIGIFEVEGFHPIIWLLFLVPVISMASSYINLSGRWSPRT